MSDTTSTQPIPGRTRVTVLISGNLVNGIYHGMTTDLTQSLIGIPRSTTPPHLWPSLSPGNGKCIFKLFSLDLVSFEIDSPPTKSNVSSTDEGGSTSIPVELGPVKIAEGEVWRSNRGQHERFEIMEDVHEGQDVKLLGIDTPGYRRDTVYEKFFKYYYKDDNGPTSSSQALPNSGE